MTYKYNVLLCFWNTLIYCNLCKIYKVYSAFSTMKRKHPTSITITPFNPTIKLSAEWTSWFILLSFTVWKKRWKYKNEYYHTPRRPIRNVHQNIEMWCSPPPNHRNGYSLSKMRSTIHDVLLSSFDLILTLCLFCSPVPRLLHPSRLRVEASARSTEWRENKSNFPFGCKVKLCLRVCF